jgi:hypothetical protein
LADNRHRRVIRGWQDASCALDATGSVGHRIVRS